MIEAGSTGMDPGLCGHCRHGHQTLTRRGPIYLRCLLAARDPAWPKYPRLPVRSCSGFSPVEPKAATGDLS